MKKRLFLILAIVLVLAIAGFKSMRTISSSKDSSNKLFSGSSVKENLEDSKTDDQVENENKEVETKKEQAKQEELYVESNKVDEKNSSNDSSNSISSSNNENSSNAKASTSQDNTSSSGNQTVSQASDISSNNANEKATVDTTHPDYVIHRGIIDCTESSKCLDKSIPIQITYKRSILSSDYVDVYATDGSILGYFIEYKFKEYTYSSYEECNDIGSKIKSALSNRVTGYTCSSSATLKINTIY